MRNASMDVVYLAACGLNGTVPDRERVAAMDLEAVYSIAARHMISAAIAFALESAGYRDQKSSAAIAAAVRKAAIFDQAWGRIRGKLEEAGIWYMPLKGAVLKDLYPIAGMREFVDYDILIDASRADDVIAIMGEQGFSMERFGASNHDCFVKQPCLNFEMHRALFCASGVERFFVYYSDVEKRLICGEGFERRFTPEDFYLYSLAHEYKHYDNSGTGLRSLMDTCVYLRSVRLDMDYVAAEAEKLGLTAFEERNRSLALCLFAAE